MSVLFLLQVELAKIGKEKNSFDNTLNMLRICRKKDTISVDFRAIDKWLSKKDITIMCKNPLWPMETQLVRLKTSSILLMLHSPVLRKIMSGRVDSTYREETELVVVMPEVKPTVLSNIFHIMRTGLPGAALELKQLSEAIEICNDLQLPSFVCERLNLGGITSTSDNLLLTYINQKGMVGLEANNNSNNAGIIANQKQTGPDLVPLNKAGKTLIDDDL